MICNENTKINGKRLIMAVAVVAVMICALAIVLPAGNVSAADEYGSIEVPTGDDVCTIDADNAANFDWTAIATDDYTAYVIEATVTIGAGQTVTFSEPVYIVDGGSLTLDGTGSKVIDAPVYLKDGASLVLGSYSLEVTENCEIQVEAGATINVNSSSLSVDTNVIGTSDDSKTMVILSDGMATISDFDMLLGAVPTGFTVDLDGVADLKQTDIMSASAFGKNTVLNVGKGSELTVSGSELTSAATINNNGTVTVSGSITNTGSIVNNGTVTISGTVTSDDGTIVNNGAATVTGTVTGKITNNGSVSIQNGTVGAIDGGDVTASGTLTTYPRMADEAEFVLNNETLVVFSYTYEDVVYQYGLAVHSIQYDNTPIMDSELSIIPKALPVADGGVLEFSNTSSMWYNPATNSSYEGALEADNTDGEAAPAAGLYDGVVRFNASITGKLTDDAQNAEFVNNTVTKYLDLIVTPGVFTGVIDIEGWVEGQYDPEVNGPTITVSTTGGAEVPAENYSVAYEYFTDEDCTQSAGTDPAALEADTYWVKATVTTDDTSYTVTVDPKEFTVEVYKLDSEIVFHPLQDLNDDALEEAILGVNPDEIQKVVFNTEDGLKYTINGSVYKQTYTEGTKIVGFDKFADDGYLVAFYVEGIGFDITSIPAGESVIADYVTMAGLNDNKITEITPVENETQYRYYLLYIPDLAADAENPTVPEAGQDGFTYDIDFDTDDGEKYNKTSYEVDASYLNFYMIILHDDKEAGDNYYNDLLTYYRTDGEQFILPSGAGDGFSYWATEAGSTNDRVFEFGSIMVVGPQYDPDNDGVINLQAVYGAVAPGPGGDTGVTGEPSANVVVGFLKNDAGVTVTFTPTDGGYVPAGDVTITYVYYQYNEDRGRYMPAVGTYSATIEDGQIFMEIPATEFSGFEAISQMTFTLTVSEDVAFTNTGLFTPVLPAIPEA